MSVHDRFVISSQSLNLGGRRGTTDDVATIPFHPSLSSAALRESPNPIPVHSLMLSFHLFFCLPLLLVPFTVPCRIVFAMPEDLEMWPYHPSFRFFTMVRRSSCTTMSSAKWKLVMSRPPMLTLPLWSFKASHMFLSRKMLKRAGESRYPCRTPTVVLNHSPVPPLNRTALLALSYRFSMARMMLALMLYFLLVALTASCHTLPKAFLKSMKTW